MTATKLDVRRSNGASWPSPRRTMHCFRHWIWCASTVNVRRVNRMRSSITIGKGMDATGKFGAYFRKMLRVSSSPPSKLTRERSKDGAAGSVSPRHAAAHASTNLHSDRPSATAWCTVIPRATPPPSTRVACTASSDAGSSFMSTSGTSRSNVCTSCSSSLARRLTSASDSATTNLTPSEAEQRMATSPVSAR
uniref:Uncharacterized protein n=2 Tax=Arundo donax TaxID=35708 RepID=A0A0A9BA32_ARUDO